MIARILVVFLAVFSRTESIAGQILTLNEFNKSLTTSSCPDNYVLVGERIVLTATLNASQTNTSYWPLNINLESSSFITTNICQVSLQRDDCPGYNPKACGYCDSQNHEIHHLVFNVTAEINYTNYVTFRGLLVDTFLTPHVTNAIRVGIIGDLFSDVLYSVSTTYFVKEITLDTFIPLSKSTFLYIRFPDNIPVQSTTWHFNSVTGNINHLSNGLIEVNTSTWDEHIDDTIYINIQDRCYTNWSLTVPVTDRPEAVCELPILCRSNSSGTTISNKCQISSPANLLRLFACRASIVYSDIFFDGVVETDGDFALCTININDSNFIFRQQGPAVNFTTWWTYILDTQYTNNKMLLPRVVRFKVNGNRSVTVDQGTDISFECKVYGNPSARSVLVGTGIGRIQNFSFTDLLRYTLTDVQCQDTGRYFCKGVNGLGITHFENQAYVDVNVKCPPAIRSHAPSNQDRKFSFVNDVLITLEVYGYPAPTEFGLQEQQGSSYVNIRERKYTTKYIPLNPSIGLVSLLISRNEIAEFSTYNLTIYSGTNRSVDFIFQIVTGSYCYMPLIIIVYLAIKLTRKKNKETDVTKVITITAETTESPAEGTRDSQGDTQVKQPRESPGRSDHSESSEPVYTDPASVPCDSHTYEELNDLEIHVNGELENACENPE